MQVHLTTPQSRLGRWLTVAAALLMVPIVLWFGLTLLLVFLILGAIGAIGFWIRSLFQPKTTPGPTPGKPNAQSSPSDPNVIEAEYELVSRSSDDQSR